MFEFLGTQRVFLFLDRKTKEPTGDATVTFQSADSAQKAIEMFHESDFNGHGTINVKIATPEQKNPFAEMLVSKTPVFYMYDAMTYLIIFETYDYGLDRAKYKGTFNLSQILIKTPSGDFKQVSEEF